MASLEEQLFSGPTGPQWRQIGVRPHHGIVLPLFSLHSGHSPIGEYPDLMAVADWCHSVGFDTIQLLPLNDTGNQTSPYSARSAFALNLMHLRLDALPEMDEALVKAAALAPQSGHRLDYLAIWNHKRKFLDLYCQRVGSRLRNQEEYKAFVANNPWLEGYALYKVLKRASDGKHWEEWRPEWRDADAAMRQRLVQENQAFIETQLITQFLCHTQLETARAHAQSQGVFLMGDIPILIDRDSADVWLNRSYFQMEANAGSPPDEFNAKGQAWGFPPYQWTTLAQDGHSWWRQRLQAAARYYQLVRIDHIVGFFRIWTIPNGHDGKDGHFEPRDQATWIDRGRDLLTMMTHASSLLPIGEDLGTVPNGVRPCMHALGICGTRVIRWEKRWATDRSFVPFDQYDPLSLTTVSTHDTEPLLLWWQRDPTAATLAPSARALLEASHRTASLFHINLLSEYLAHFPDLTWGNPAEDQINVPGTVSPNNWSIRLRPPLESWTSHAGLRDWLQKLSKT